MSKLRPNRKSGQGKYVNLGFLGKYKTYKNTEFERVPELTDEERNRLLNEKLKPYTYDPRKHKVVRAAGPVGEAPTPTPTGYTEADAYLTAVVDAGGTGITPTISAATRTFYNSLMVDGLYDKLIAFYPFIGGTAGSHKFNGKDPRDLDAAFRLTFYGGITHSSDGIQPNGVNGYGDTHLNPLDYLDNTQGSLGSYIQTTATTKSYPAEIGCAFYGQQMMLRSKNSPNLLGSLYAGWTQSSPQLQDGLVVISRTSNDSADLGYYQRGSVSYTGGPNTTDISGMALDIYIGVSNLRGIGISEQSDRVQSFSFIGYGLTPTEVSDLSDAVNTLQTALSRNTY